MDTNVEQPKKYIRTFEGDIETFKKGGVPDLVPLTAQPRPAAEQSITPPSPLKTYASDFSERMKETQASTATVLAAEQDSTPRNTEVAEEPPKFSRSNMLYSIAGGILIIAGGIGAYIAYTRFVASSEPIILAPSATAPIFVDDRQQISGTGTVLLQAIEQSVTRPLSAGSVRLLYLENATTTSVFSALQLPAPGALLRNSNAARSMAGVVNVGGVQSPFFILSVTSYSDTFAAMLQWEPHMVRDLAKFFPAYPPLEKTSATTTLPLASTPAPVLTFVDAVIANHDVRVYRDALGREVLLYGYWNQTTLVIARTTEAFTEILRRLATSRAQ